MHSEIHWQLYVNPEINHYGLLIRLAIYVILEANSLIS